MSSRAPKKSDAQRQPDRPEPVRPEPFDKTAFRVGQLKQTIANQADAIATLQADLQEMTEFVRANAELLGLTVVDGTAPPADHTHEGDSPEEEN